jgi:hypothetical protein
MSSLSHNVSTVLFMFNIKGRMKSELHTLSNYGHLFTEKYLVLLYKYLVKKTVQAPSIVKRMPGQFTVNTKLKSVNYTSTDDGITRHVVPTEKRMQFLEKLWSVRTVPRGQESFQRYISARFVNIPARLIRNFVAKVPAIQLTRPLNHGSQGRLAVRSKYPFQRISFDLADCVSFSDVRGEDEPRYLLIVCDDFSSFVFAKLLDNKTASECAKKMKSIIKSIRKIGGKPVFASSDKGPEFLGAPFQALLKKEGIRHLVPKAIRIQPFVENRVKQVKRYLRLQELLFSGVHWYESDTIKSATRSVNRIMKKKINKSPEDIVRMWKKGASLEDLSSVSNNKRKDFQVGFGQIDVGDHVRVRKVEQKVSLAHKTHLGLKGDDLERTINWTNTVYTVKKIRRLNVRRTLRIQISNGDWHYRSELLKVPNTKRYNKADRITIYEKAKTVYITKTKNVQKPKKQTLGSKTDLDSKNIIVGKRRRKKRVRY